MSEQLQKLVELALTLESMDQSQQAALDVLGEGTMVMERNGAGPWDVAMVTYYFDRLMSGKSLGS